MSRKLIVAVVGLATLWFVFVGSQTIRQRMQMRAIASDLYMRNRTFSVLSGTLDPPTSVPGEERLLVLGKSNDNFLVCSIVRNPLFDDFRSQWKVDTCYRPDLNPEYSRIPIWRSFEQYPTEAELRLFRKESLEQPWVTWDCPDGTDPKIDIVANPSKQLVQEPLE